MRPNFIHQDCMSLRRRWSASNKSRLNGCSRKRERKRVSLLRELQFNRLLTFRILFVLLLFYSFFHCFICLISGVIKKKKRLLVVVGFAVEFRVSGVAGIVEHDATDAAGKAVLVPTRVCYSHQISIVDFSAATLAHFVGLLAFY